MCSISSTAGKEMAGGTASLSDWRNWCRLCAKEDAQNRNIYLKEEFIHNEEHLTAEMLISVINNYFSVEIQMLDILPQQLCTECFTFLETLISFQGRAVKVQQMYAELRNHSESNIQTNYLRLKEEEVAKTDKIFSISSTDGKEMSGGTASLSDCRNWCRLCGKKDGQNKNIRLKEEFLHSEEQITAERLINVINKYFSVEIQMLDMLPQQLCTECFPFIKTLISFQRRVVKVQQMYVELKNLSDASFQTEALRLKCHLLNAASSEESLVATMVIKQEEEVVIGDKSVWDFQGEEAMVIKQEEGQEVATADKTVLEFQSLEDMDIKQDEEEEVAIADESVCDFQSEEAMVIKQEDEEEEVATADEIVSYLQSLEGMDIKQDEEEEVATEDESMCDFQSGEAMVIKQEEEEEVATADVSYFQRGEAADYEDRPLGTTSEDNIYRDAKEVYNDVHICETEVTAPGSASEYKYFCIKCPQRFRIKSAYSQHLNKKHGMKLKTTFSCSTCQRNFKDPSGFKRHMRTHRPKAETRIYPCPQCDRKFQTMHNVRTHIKFVHEDTRLLNCEVCGVATRTQYTLRAHMLTHTDYALFECDVCKKCFKSQGRLNKHMNIHSSEKHQCRECGLQLNSKVTLNRHMAVHSDENKYRCDYCGTTFKYATTFRRHLMGHCGLKPYSCQFCDKTFTDSSNCRSHMNHIHPSELAQMPTSHEWKLTKNTPTIAALKAIMEQGKNLVPLVRNQ